MKKLFTILIGLFVITIGFGQIIYHKYDPAVIVEVNEFTGPDSDEVIIDINGDSVNDISCQLFYWYSYASPHYNEAFKCKVISLNESTKFAHVNDWCGIKPLFLGDTITENLDWGGPGYIMYRDPWAFEDNCTTFFQYKYIALKLNFNDIIYYGWIKLLSAYSLGGSGNPSYAWLNISDFAFNEVPNYGIIAGDTITSLVPVSILESSPNEDLRIYPNPVADILTLENVNVYSNLSISSLIGEVVYQKENLNRLEIVQCTKLSSGIYFITLENSNIITTRKVIVK